MTQIELAVESASAARVAAAGGVDRIELAPDLEAGGLTPSLELAGRVVDDVALPVFAMVRPRPGDFVYSAAEIGDMCATIEKLRAAGVHGIVAGALTTERAIDTAATRALVTAADGLPFTFHRAFDRIADQAGALEQLVALGIARVLTSGGAVSALEGCARLRALVAQADGRIVILAGGGIRETNVREVIQLTGVAEIHTRLIDGAELTSARVRRFRELVVHRT